MKNKTVRKLLKLIYGEGCFMERAGIRKITPQEEVIMKKTIKGFKTLDRTITYHHLKARENGGETTIENGANLARYNHSWLHEQSKEKQEEVNNQLREFKNSINFAKLTLTEQGVDLDKIDVSFEDCDLYTIPVKDNSELTEKEINKLKFLRKQKTLNKRKNSKYEEYDEYER